MKIGFYAGSFDPFTIGHLHIVKVSSELFDKVVVGIGVNPAKTRHFDKTEMKEAMEKMFKEEGIKNVECVIFEDLTVDAAISFGANFLIRGVRNGVDYGAEENLASINQEISGLDTIYIRAGQFGAISSSMVNELFKRGKDVSKYLPNYVVDVVTKSKVNH